MDLVQEKVDIKTAAQRLGITQEGVRKRIQRGLLKAEKIDNRWLVALPAQLEEVQDRLESALYMVGEQLEEGSSLHGTGLERVVQSFLEKLERAHRENLELAGRVGFLQARLQDAEREIQMLRAPAQPPEPEMANHPTPSENGANSGSQKASPRPWWQFWRWYQP